MDACEATKVVMSRIKDLDPENASKILGHILLQGQGEKEVIRLAFAPEYLLRSCINQAKAFMGISSTSPSANALRQNATTLPRTSPRMLNTLHFNGPSAFSRSGSRPISFAGAFEGSVDASGDDDFLGGGGGFDPLQVQVQEAIASPSGRNDCLIFPYSDDFNTVPSPFPQALQRSNSATAAGGFPPNLELGRRPCMYFAKGECKNGSSCRFFHSEIETGERLEMGSPSVNPSFVDEFLRQKALQQQRSAHMVSGGLHHIPFNYSNLQDENHRSDLPSTGFHARTSSSSQQIYLTYPADSTFTEDDVASYFNTFGPVQDVRIPYQQKRMFGFVSFVNPETVKTILAIGNPHFIGDARVLVKPYKEKGKMNEKKHLHQQIEKGDYSSGLSGNDSIEQLDIPFGPRMLLSAQGKMSRRKFEDQMDLRNAVELQGQRMMNMQLVDSQDQTYDSEFPSSLPNGSPRWTDFLTRLNAVPPSDAMNHGAFQDFDDGRASSPKYNAAAASEFSSNNEIQHHPSHADC